MKHILFDLDGTLLPMDLKTYVKAYFGGLCKRFIKYGIDPDLFIKAMWNGVGAMTKNNGPKTNEEVFEDSFYSEINIDIDTARREFEDYYTVDFPSVKSVCRLTDTSRKIIDACRKKGYDTVLATSPIFPKIATYQRMSWVGLYPEDFAEVTTFEKCTSSKPSLEYYKAILQRHGFAPEDCLMVGNDIAEDMVIRELGVKTFLVEGFIENSKGLPEVCDRRGSLEELLEFIENS